MNNPLRPISPVGCVDGVQLSLSLSLSLPLSLSPSLSLSLLSRMVPELGKILRTSENHCEPALHLEYGTQSMKWLQKKET